MKIVIVAALLLAFAWADTFEDDADFNDIFNAYPSYPAGAGRVGRAQPYYVPQPSPPAPQNYEKVYEKTYAAQPYSFAYEVNEDYNNYGHQQESDGSVTTGTYRVLLPDGRLQIVTYRADKNGYTADVKYVESSSPYKAPAYKAPAAPAYKAPAPATPAYKAPAPAPAPVAPAYKAPAPAPVAPVYKAPAPTPAPAYKEPEYEAPAAPAPAPAYRVPEYEAPSAPAYEAPADPVYEAPTTPVYEAPTTQAYKAPPTTPAPVVYRIPLTTASTPVYRAPPTTAAPVVYRAPATTAYKAPAPTTPAVYRPPSTAAPTTYKLPTPLVYRNNLIRRLSNIRV